MRNKRTAFFAPIPQRAMEDERLTGVDWRALAAVSYHHRLGRNGRPCLAKLETLAKEVRCNPTTLSESLNKLSGLGYLRRERNQRDARQWMYYVLYDEGDTSANAEVNTSANAELSRQITSANAPRNAHQVIESIGALVPNIFSKTEVIKDSAQAVAFLPRKNIGLEARKRDAAAISLRPILDAIGEGVPGWRQARALEDALGNPSLLEHERRSAMAALERYRAGGASLPAG